MLLIPGYTILGDGSFVEAFGSPPDIIYLFLRLAGLYGLTFLFIQLILGSFMQNFLKLFGPSALRWHIRQGILTYGLVLSHPTLYTIYSAQTLNIFSPLRTLWPNFSVLNEYYISFGRIGLFLLTIGVFFGIFRSHPMLFRNWRKLHILNYVAFAFVLFHSWNVGSDTHNPPFVYLYPLFVAGFATAIFYRRVYKVVKEYKRAKKKAALTIR